MKYNSKPTFRLSLALSELGCFFFYFGSHNTRLLNKGSNAMNFENVIFIDEH